MVLLSSPLPMPLWVTYLSNLSPLMVGIAGILIGRKTKATVDDLRFTALTEKVRELEETQSTHVMVLATIQAQVVEVFKSLEKVGSTSQDTLQIVSELRGIVIGPSLTAPMSPAAPVLTGKHKPHTR